MTISPQSESRIAFWNTITAKLFISIVAVLSVVLIISSWMNVHFTEERLYAQSEQQKQKLQRVYEAQYAQKSADLIARVQPKLEMLQQLVKQPLIDVARSNVLGFNDPETLKAMQECFDYQERKMLRCARKYIRFTQIHHKELTQKEKELIVTVVRSILKEPDMEAVWIENIQQTAYMGFRKDEWDSLVFLNNLNDLKPGLSSLALDVREDDGKDPVGKVVIYYSKAGLQQILQTAETQRTAEAAAIEARVDAEIEHALFSNFLEALAQFAILLLAIVVISLTTLIRPLNRLRETADEIAHGNWNKSIETHRSDELGSLARSFANMRDAIQQMMEVIQEQNRTLEQKVSERTAQLKQKTNDITNMLQNMHQGVLTILSNGRIHHEYSAYVCTVFEVEDVTDDLAMEVLFAASNINSDQWSQIATALDCLIGADAFMFDFNKHLLIPEIQVSFPKDRYKTLELEWDPILSEDETIEKMMVTIRDVTELRGLQEEAKQQKQELEMIGQILALSQKKFEEFLQTSHRLLDENTQLIQQTESKEMEVLASLFRNMHTIKGNARTYGLQHITEVLHQAEQTYDRLRKSEEATWDRDQLLYELRDTESQIERYEHVFRSKLSDFAKQSQGVYIDQTLLDKLRDTVTTSNANSLQQLKTTIKQIESVLEAVGSETLESILEDLTQNLPRLAQDLDKAPPTLTVNDRHRGHHIRFLPEIIPTLKDVFVHTFRNSLDHGLESPAERVSQGKPETGQITIEVLATEDRVEVHFYDDGRGLGLNRLKTKAVELHMAESPHTVSDSDAANLVFHSGLSTATEVTEISGRGVGMDAVKRFLQRQGADITLLLLDDNTMGQAYRPFKQVITLPSHYAVMV